MKRQPPSTNMHRYLLVILLAGVVVDLIEPRPFPQLAATLAAVILPAARFIRVIALQDGFAVRQPAEIEAARMMPTISFAIFLASGLLMVAQQVPIGGGEATGLFGYGLVAVLLAVTCGFYLKSVVALYAAFTDRTRPVPTEVDRTGASRQQRIVGIDIWQERPPPKDMIDVPDPADDGDAPRDTPDPRNRRGRRDE